MRRFRFLIYPAAQPPPRGTLSTGQPPKTLQDQGELKQQKHTRWGRRVAFRPFLSVPLRRQAAPPVPPAPRSHLQHDPVEQHAVRQLHVHAQLVLAAARQGAEGLHLPGREG